MATMGETLKMSSTMGTEKSKYLGYYFAPLPNYIYTPDTTYVPYYAGYPPSVFYASYEPGFEPHSYMTYQTNCLGGFSPPTTSYDNFYVPDSAGSSPANSPSKKAPQKKSKIKKKRFQVAKRASLEDVPEEGRDFVAEKLAEEEEKGRMLGSAEETFVKGEVKGKEEGASKDGEDMAIILDEGDVDEAKEAIFKADFTRVENVQASEETEWADSEDH